MQNVSRVCTKCLIEKPLHEFIKNKNCKLGREYTCKLCSKIRTIRWLKNTKFDIKTYRKNFKLLRKYNITITQYKKMHKEQSGKCSICKKAEVKKIKGSKISLSVDHCHKTKKVRGLLCGNCNSLIGLAKESVFILEQSVSYLNKYNKKLA